MEVSNLARYDKKDLFRLCERIVFKDNMDDSSCYSSPPSTLTCTDGVTAGAGKAGEIESSLHQPQYNQCQQKQHTPSNYDQQKKQRMTSNKHTDTASNIGRGPDTDSEKHESTHEAAAQGSRRKGEEDPNIHTTPSPKDEKHFAPVFNDPLIPRSKMKTQDPCLKRKRIDPWMDFMKRKDMEDRLIAAGKATMRTTFWPNPAEAKSDRFPALAPFPAFKSSSQTSPYRNERSQQGKQCYDFSRVSLYTGTTGDQGELMKIEEPSANPYNQKQNKEDNERTIKSILHPFHFQQQSEYQEKITKTGLTRTDSKNCEQSKSWSMFFPPVPPLSKPSYLSIPGTRGRLANMKFVDATGKNHQVGYQQCSVQHFSQPRQKFIAGQKPTYPLADTRLILQPELRKSISENNSRRQVQSLVIQQPYTNRNIQSLSTPADENWLSEFLCFVRSDCVEVFTASQDDVASRMNSKKVLLDQVGIRCRYCAHISHRDRAGRSSSYPSSLSRIYQSLSMMLRDHFPRCHMMPHDVKKKYLSLKANTTQGATNSKKYWVESAKNVGLVDTTVGGIRFVASESDDAAAADNKDNLTSIIGRCESAKS